LAYNKRTFFLALANFEAAEAPAIPAPTTITS
jgi:hypothetical protein